MSYLRPLHIYLALNCGISYCIHRIIANENHNNLSKNNFPHLSDKKNVTYNSRSSYLTPAIETKKIDLNFKSIIKKLRDDFWTVQARRDPPCGITEAEEYVGGGANADADAQLIAQLEAENALPVVDNLNFGGTPIPAVGAVLRMHKNANRRDDPQQSTGSLIAYGNYLIFCDSITRTPCFTMEAYSKQNIDLLEHIHGESLSLGVNMPRGYHFGKFTDQRLNIDYIIPAAPRVELNHIICDYCQRSTVWKAFHNYLRYLTQFNSHVFVCSGPIFLKKYGGDCSDLSGRNWRPSHYFKVIFCFNSRENYRFECYMFENKPVHELNPDIREYLVTRNELQNNTQIRFFPYISSKWIKNAEPSAAYFRNQPRDPSCMEPERASCSF